MMAILGSLLGLFGAAVPEIFKIFQDKRDKRFEIEMLEAQARNAEKLREYDAKLFASQAEANYFVEEQKRIGQQQSNDKTGIRWVDALNAIVRPVLALGFLALFSFIKICIVLNTDILIIVSDPSLVWNDEDSAIFAAIVSFYFGSRTLEKFRKGFK
jgi:hypothetical protein